MKGKKQFFTASLDFRFKLTRNNRPTGASMFSSGHGEQYDVDAINGIIILSRLVFSPSMSLLIGIRLFLFSGPGILS